MSTFRPQPRSRNPLSTTGFRPPADCRWPLLELTHDSDRAPPTPGDPSAVAGVRATLGSVADACRCGRWTPPRPPPPSTRSRERRRSWPSSRPGCWPTPTRSRSPPTRAPPRPRTGTPTPPAPPGPPPTGPSVFPTAWRPTTSPAPPSPPAGSTPSRPRPSSTPSPTCPTTSTPNWSSRPNATCSSRPPTFDAKALKILGRRILEVASPEAADAHEAALLEREERDAQAATRLTMYQDGHGKVHGRFTLDTLTGAMLKKHLYALAAPKHRAATEGPLGERRPTPERLGHAFTELIQRYPTKRLPKAGGLNATVVVLMDLDTLIGRPQSRPPRHRRNHLPRRRPPPRLPSPDHPRRPRRQVPGPRPRPSQTLLHRGPTHRQDHRSRRLRGRRLRRTTRHDPHAPPRTLGRRRPNQPRRHHDLPTPPPPSPRHPLPR